jgi:hypothetical protein
MWNNFFMMKYKFIFLMMALWSVCSMGYTDSTGMVPGDIVISNLTENGPGHAGIYIGRWSEMPRDLQSRYAQALKEAAVRSGVPEIMDSYLVVDSMPGRGVRVALFAEQFTGYHGGTNAYYPRLTKFDLAGILRFENNKGMVVRLNSLPDHDSRRWKIVEQALQLAIAHVPYDDRHGQLATTSVGEGLRRMADGKGLALDCISFCHFVYDKAAGIDLDTSWMPFHTPGQLYDYAQKNRLARVMTFQPVLWDTAYLGTWKPVKSSMSFSGLSDDEKVEAKEAMTIPAGTQFEVRRISNDFVYTMREVQNGKQVEGEDMVLKLDKAAQNPVGAGCAKLERSESGISMQMSFKPVSAEQAIMTLHMSAKGKKVSMTVTLARERTARRINASQVRNGTR